MVFLVFVKWFVAVSPVALMGVLLIVYALYVFFKEPEVSDAQALDYFTFDWQRTVHIRAKINRDLGDHLSFGKFYEICGRLEEQGYIEKRRIPVLRDGLDKSGAMEREYRLVQVEEPNMVA